MIVENLVHNYREDESRAEYKNLCKRLVEALLKDISITDTWLSGMYHAASSMYVKNNFSQNCDFTFVNKMYERFCTTTECRMEYCDDYTAKVIYDFKNRKQDVSDHEKLLKALCVFVFENGRKYNDGIRDFLNDVYEKTKADSIMDIINNSLTIE